MNTEWLAIVMFVMFMGLILIGYPVAFSFALTAVAFTMLGLWLGDIRVQQLNALPSRWFGYISDQNLLAIPFFVYMGAIFEKSGQAERLLTAVGRLMGPLRGGLGAHRRPRRHDARRGDRRRRRHGDHDGTVWRCRRWCATATTTGSPPASSPRPGRSPS